MRATVVDRDGGDKRAVKRLRAELPKPSSRD
jgi:hypothetical protein